MIIYYLLSNVALNCLVYHLLHLDNVHYVQKQVMYKHLLTIVAFIVAVKLISYVFCILK